MLSYSIAIQARVSTAIMNMATLISTTTKGFTEYTRNSVTVRASIPPLLQQAMTASNIGVTRNK
jgi:hypothetical protein